MSKTGAETVWYKGWFDSPYYHILYHKRNEQEAAQFITRLCQYLHPAAGSKVLDLACGKGRHSLVLHSLGLDVTGIDLSPSSIAAASASETERLEFFVHDMRRPFRIRYYDIVFNLFTSFGYFDSERDNRQVLESVHKGLKPGGTLVIDFFNALWVQGCLSVKSDYTETASGIEFKIHKQTDGKFIHKTIRFSDNGTEYNFREQVQLLKSDDFKKLMHGLFEITAVFGNYELGPLEETTSPRLILIARKL
ncbi:MAG: methyltransferase domain-containing protein [Bacteroidia bacterium]|jgi:SAM-dependent methyltransferase|nr:methyltransferase domain-containing protein [Bacteroidia bacterium]